MTPFVLTMERATTEGWSWAVARMQAWGVDDIRFDREVTHLWWEMNEWEVLALAGVCAAYPPPNDHLSVRFPLSKCLDLFEETLPARIAALPEWCHAVYLAAAHAYLVEAMDATREQGLTEYLKTAHNLTSLLYQHGTRNDTSVADMEAAMTYREMAEEDGVEAMRARVRKVCAAWLAGDDTL